MVRCAKDTVASCGRGLRSGNRFLIEGLRCQVAIRCGEGGRGVRSATELDRIMKNHPREIRNRRRRPLLTMASAVAPTVVFFMSTVAALRSQSAIGQPTPTGQTINAQHPIPQWQKDAGGKMQFDVASVKLNKADSSIVHPASNIPLGAMDAFSPTGGLLQATGQPFLQYLIFAYKLTSNQVLSAFEQFPKWADTNRYDIQGRASGNPTKDQFRLMMQSLLAERFKLAVHYETKREAVLGLVLAKPGKIGPKLRLHPSNAPCSTAGPPQGASTALQTSGFPVECGEIMTLQPSAPGRLRFGARNITMSMFATFFSAPNATGLSNSLVDKTGLTGNVDFLMEWSPEIRPGSGFQPDPNGPTFLEALKDQLGMKLRTETGPVNIFVVDHVQEPSPN